MAKEVRGPVEHAAVITGIIWSVWHYPLVFTDYADYAALVAVMHKLAVAVWHILRYKTTYQDLGPTTSPNAIPNVPCAAWSRRPTVWG